MKQNLVIDFELLKSFNISVEEFIFLYNISIKVEDINTFNVDLQKLQEQKLIKIIKENNKTKYILREKSIKLLDFSTINFEVSIAKETKIIKKSERSILEDINQRLEEFRNKWKGLKPGSMGSQKACKTKLIRWMKENPNYTFDDILKAADIYIESLGGNYTFLQRADYFIFKQENNREESSRLSAYIDEIGMISSDDWTTNLR